MSLLLEHANNTAELSGIIEALYFFNSMRLVPRGSQACFFMVLHTLLVFCLDTLVWQAATRPYHKVPHLAMERTWRVGADHAAVLGALDFF